MNDKRQLSVPMIQAGVIALFLAIIVVLAVRGLMQDREDDVATSAAGTTTTTSIAPADRSAAGPDTDDATTDTTGGAPSGTSDEPTFAQRLDRITIVVPETSSTTTVVADTTPVPEPIRIPRPTCADGLEATVTQTAPFTGLQASIPIRPISAAECARRTLVGVARNRGLIPVGAEVTWEWRLMRFAPRLVDRVARWRADQFRRHRTTA